MEVPIDLSTNNQGSSPCVLILSRSRLWESDGLCVRWASARHDPLLPLHEHECRQGKLLHLYYTAVEQLHELRFLSLLVYKDITVPSAAIINHQ